MTLAKIKQYPTKEKEAKNTVWSLKRPLLNTFRKILSMAHGVSRKLIMFKAKSIYDEKFGDNEELKAGFVASNVWLTKFINGTTFLYQDEQQ